jgi:hypothetical protein
VITLEWEVSQGNCYSADIATYAMQYAIYKLPTFSSPTLSNFLFVICSLKREEEERVALKVKSGRMRAAQ